MVSICAGCDAVEPWAAFIIGLIGGATFVVYSEGVFKLGVDDPLDAFAVHFGGGFWGVIAVCLFEKDAGILVKVIFTSARYDNKTTYQALRRPG